MTGNLTKENLAGVFRMVSQKRRNGTLEISFHGQTLLIIFSQGKIVQIHDVQRPLCREICNRLQKAEKLPKKSYPFMSALEITLEMLFEELISQKLVSEEDFFCAKNACELDLLYSLSALDSGRYDFQQSITHVDPEFSLNISAGQFLLDLVDYDAIRLRFSELFGDLQSTDICIEVSKSQIQDSHETKNVVWHLLSSYHTLAQIHEHSLLSEYHLKNLLCAWYDKGLISIERVLDLKPVPPQVPAKSAVHTKKPEISLDHKLDNEMLATDTVTLEKSPVQLPEIKKLADTRQYITPHVAPKKLIDLTTIDEALQAFETFPDLPSLPQLPDEDDSIAKSFVSIQADKLSQQQVQELTQSPEISKNAGILPKDIEQAQIMDKDESSQSEDLQQPASRVHPSFKEYITQTSYALLQEEAFPQVVFLVSLAYLGVFIFLSPQLVDNWFHAVTAFSTFLVLRQ